MLVRDVMTPEVVVLPLGASLADVARRMRDEDIGSVPISEGDRLVGMVTDRDVIIRGLADSADPTRLTAADVMSHKVLYCFEEQSVDDALQNMGEQQVRRLPVLNRDKRLVGMVSLGDLSQAQARKAGDALKDISEPAPGSA